MSNWIWKAVKLIVAGGCGIVVLFGPSEVDALAVAQAAGRLPALALLSVISLGSLAGALLPERCATARVSSLRLAGYTLLMYGGFAIAVKHLVALPTGALAIAVGLLYVDRAARIVGIKPTGDGR